MYQNPGKTNFTAIVENAEIPEKALSLSDRQREKLK
jgi:hypothetical protein